MLKLSSCGKLSDRNAISAAVGKIPWKAESEEFWSLLVRVVKKPSVGKKGGD